MRMLSFVLKETSKSIYLNSFQKLLVQIATPEVSLVDEGRKVKVIFQKFPKRESHKLKIIVGISYEDVIAVVSARFPLCGSKRRQRL